jgi:hypothetical protein
VLSLTGNPCNEDYLAVCGLKVSQIHYRVFRSHVYNSSLPVFFASLSTIFGAEVFKVVPFDLLLKSIFRRRRGDDARN